MIPHRIRCEVFVVRTESGVCPGMAKMEQGEVYAMDGRTPPGSRGICCQAFTAMSDFRTALMVTDKLDSYREDIRFQLREYNVYAVTVVMIGYQGKKFFLNTDNSVIEPERHFS